MSQSAVNPDDYAATTLVKSMGMLLGNQAAMVDLTNQGWD
jgi:hypothetical protein